MTRLMMTMAALLLVALGPVTAAAERPGLEGDWAGALAAGGVTLRLVFHISGGPQGPTGTVDSVDQGAVGRSLSAVRRDGPAVVFEVAAPRATFEGDLDALGQTLTGHWKQGAASLPLVLTRRAAGAAPVTLNRPQTPTKPYPYVEEEVAFDDLGGHARLAGALTLPPGPGPFPAAVLVAGSGPNTRDEPILGHRLFLVLADHLTRGGLAVLRYDKRGTGASTGDYARATTRDFADDVQAALAWLRARGDTDPARIGLIGHSEGGLIAPMVAAQDPKVAFVVMMAGPGVNGAAILDEQGRLITRAMGMSEAKITQSSALRDEAIAIVRAEKDPAAAAAKIRARLSAAARDQGLTDQQIEAQIAVLNSEWFRFFFDYDPAPTLRQVRAPVLALIGAKDLQVSAAQNLPAIRAALAANPNAEVDELPSLNHLFQTAVTGGFGEYGAIEETIAPSALDLIAGWIHKQVGR